MALGLTTLQKDRLNSMCPAAAGTYVGSMLDTFVPEATLASTLAGAASSLTAAGSALDQQVTITNVGTTAHVGSALVWPVFVGPPGGALIDAVKLVVPTVVTTSASDYWTVNLHNFTDSVSLLAAARTTTTSAILAGVPWSLGTLTNTAVAEDEVIMLGLTNAQSATVTTMSVVVNWRHGI